MPESFYGGKSGQSFEITTLFNNKAELDADIAKSFNSEIPVNSFVGISYGRKNKDSYEVNKQIDKSRYGECYDSTLWYKVYSELAISDSSVSDLERYGVKYVLIYDFAGETPVISFADTDLLNPSEDPYIDIMDISDPNRPIFQAHLPRSVNWYTGLKLSSRDSNLQLQDNTVLYYVGDFYLNKYNGNLYKCTRKTGADNISFWTYEGNILGPTLEVNDINVETLSSLEPADVTITQQRDGNDVLIPLVDFLFKIPRGSKFYSGTGVYSNNALISVTDGRDIKPGDYFLESTTAGKIGSIYYLNENNSWEFVTSIIGRTPQIAATSIPVNPDKDLVVSVTYRDDDEAKNFPSLRFEIPRGTKWFVQETYPTTGTSSPNLAALGDYLFKTDDGFIYQYAEIGTNIFDWVQIGTFVVDLSEIETIGIDPYVKQNDGSFVPASADLDIVVDETHSAAHPKVVAQMPNAPLVTVNKVVDTLSAEDRGEVNLTYNVKGYELKFKLPRGLTGEAGKGLNIRRSFDSIADRDNNTEGLIWNDGDGCAVKIDGSPDKQGIYVYQTDYPGGWIYVGVLSATTIMDTQVTVDNTWSSSKINSELNSLRDQLQGDIEAVSQELNDIIKQNISEQLETISTKVGALETDLATTKTDISSLKRLITTLSVGIEENATAVTQLTRAIGERWTWGQLKNGKKISLTAALMSLARRSEDELL